MAEPRPTRANEALRTKAAEAIFVELLADGHLVEGDRDDAIKSIAKYGYWSDDGYDLAKHLDSQGWSCNLEIAEILDGYSSCLDDQVRSAEREWADTVSLQPFLADGTHVAFGRHGETGIIDGVSTYGAGKYSIIEDGDPLADSASRRRRIVNFEDVRVLAA